MTNYLCRASALVGVMLSAWLGVAHAGEVPVGSVLPDATLHGLNGQNRMLSSYRGHPLLINVWASWCGPCRQEMASLERLAWNHPTQSFAIIGISTDDDPAMAAGLLRTTHATISHFIDQQLELENLLGASRLPLTVLVDSDGRIRGKVYGAREWDGAEARRLIDETFQESFKDRKLRSGFRHPAQSLFARHENPQ